MSFNIPLFWRRKKLKRKSRSNRKQYKKQKLPPVVVFYGSFFFPYSISLNNNAVYDLITLTNRCGSGGRTRRKLQVYRRRWSYNSNERKFPLFRHVETNSPCRVLCSLVIFRIILTFFIWKIINNFILIGVGIVKIWPQNIRKRQKHSRKRIFL